MQFSSRAAIAPLVPWSSTAATLAAGRTWKRVRDRPVHQVARASQSNTLKYDEAVGHLIAMKSANPGDVLVEEEPLVWVQDFEESDDEDVEPSSFEEMEAAMCRAREERCRRALAAFSKLSEEQKAYAMSLFCPGEPGAGWETWEAGDSPDARFLRILRANGIHMPGDRTGLYVTSSRSNHSCRPNARLCVAPSGTLRLVVLRSLHAGAEITVSYLPEHDLLQPSQVRQRLLEFTWAFSCACPRCTSPDDRRSISCPCCSERGHQNIGYISHHTKFLQLGAGRAEVSSWAACSTCGSSPDKQHLFRVESYWLHQYRQRVPLWCRGPAGRKLMRCLIWNDDTSDTFARLKALIEEAQDDGFEENEADMLIMDLDESSTETGGTGEDEHMLDEQQLAVGLANAIRFYRDLLVAEKTAGAGILSAKAHWMRADAAGAASEAGLLLLRQGDADTANSTWANLRREQTEALPLCIEEVVQFSSDRLLSVRHALGDGSLNMETVVLHGIQAAVLALDPSSIDAVATLQQQAVRTATALSSTWEDTTDCTLDVLLREAGGSSNYD